MSIIRDRLASSEGRSLYNNFFDLDCKVMSTQRDLKVFEAQRFCAFYELRKFLGFPLEDKETDCYNSTRDFLKEIENEKA